MLRDHLCKHRIALGLKLFPALMTEKQSKVTPTTPSNANKTISVCVSSNTYKIEPGSSRFIGNLNNFHQGHNFKLSNALDASTMCKTLEFGDVYIIIRHCFLKTHRTHIN